MPRNALFASSIRPLRLITSTPSGRSSNVGRGSRATSSGTTGLMVLAGSDIARGDSESRERGPESGKNNGRRARAINPAGGSLSHRGGGRLTQLHLRRCAVARPKRPWDAQQESLQVVDADLDQHLALARVLHALGDHGLTHVMAKPSQLLHHSSLLRVLVDAANDGQVDLHEFRLQLPKSARVALPRAQIVDGDSEAEGAQALDPFTSITHCIQRRAVRQLQDDALRDARQ